MLPELCPLKFEARLVPRIWGGRRLGAWGKSLPADGVFGESWEVFDDESGSTRCTEGPVAGMRLADLAKAWDRDLFGFGRGLVNGRFPLLIKLLDARADLSVQVHPDDALARELHGPAASGKSEMWVVLEAAEGAQVFCGFRPGVDAGRLRAAIADGSVMGLLQAVKVKPGDVIDVPAGRVHAIGTGCLMAEVQQNSDYTYRIWDYGRLEQGKPRKLHLEEATKALRFDALGCGNGQTSPFGVRLPWGLREKLLEGGYFRVERWTLNAAGAAGAPGTAMEGGWPRIILPVTGSARILWGKGLECRLEPGQTTLVPAALPAALVADAPGATLLCIETR